LTSEKSGWRDGRWLPDKHTWSAKVGAGASSPIVVGDRVFTLGRSEGHEVLRCLAIVDGKEQWSVRYRTREYGRFHEGDEGLYSGPSSTPEYDPQSKLLFTLSIDGDLHCWDAADKGRKVWSVNLYDAYKVGKRPKLTRAPQRDYGYTSSPLVHGPWLLVEVGSSRGTLIAFDKKTGKEVWVSQLTDEAGHNAGPVLMKVEGIECVALLTQRNLAVIRLDAGNEGKTVATYPWITTSRTISPAAVHDDCVLVTSAYNQNAIHKLRITLKGAEKVWQQKYPSKVCTPVVHDGHVYYVWQKVRCLDWKTGEQKWEGGVRRSGSCIVTADHRLSFTQRQLHSLKPQRLAERVSRVGVSRSEFPSPRGRTSCSPMADCSPRHEGNLVCFNSPKGPSRRRASPQALRVIRVCLGG
jgi:outer membrane protein assembly factor BamB